MHVVYLYRNDGSGETIELATFKGRGSKARAIRSITERRSNRTEIILSTYPKGKVVVRNVVSATVSHAVRSWDVCKLAPCTPRESAQGTGSIRAYGVNAKGKVAGRVFRTNGIADTVGAQACLRKHPVDGSYRPPSTTSRFEPMFDNAPTVYKASPC